VSWKIVDSSSAARVAAATTGGKLVPGNGPQRTPGRATGDAVKAALRAASALWPGSRTARPDGEALVAVAYRIFAPLADGEDIRRHLHIEWSADDGSTPRLRIAALTPLGTIILQDISEQTRQHEAEARPPGPGAD
jgi:hypothetical protein